jgi:hypothetical protein
MNKESYAKLMGIRDIIKDANTQLLGITPQDAACTGGTKASEESLDYLSATLEKAILILSNMLR